MHKCTFIFHVKLRLLWIRVYYHLGLYCLEVCMMPVIDPHSIQSRISDFHFVIRRKLKERCNLSEQSEWEILLCCMIFPNVVTVVPPILNLMGFFSDLFESFQSIQFGYHGDCNTFFSFLSVYWLLKKKLT